MSVARAYLHNERLNNLLGRRKFFTIGMITQSGRLRSGNLLYIVNTYIKGGDNVDHLAWM